eukprot:175143-Rhodomonas_salina.1
MSLVQTVPEVAYICFGRAATTAESNPHYRNLWYTLYWDRGCGSLISPRAKRGFTRSPLHVRGQRRLASGDCGTPYARSVPDIGSDSTL